MSTFLREQEIAKLENNNASDCCILSNAKCLSEGVDIPTLDGIVFVDPRESEIDIIQAVGRAIRKSKNKTKGTIILPVFIENDENSKDEIKRSDFKKIWKVINALKAHDYKLGEDLIEFRSELGRKREKYISKTIPKFIFDLPEDIDSSFERSLKTRLVEVTSESWYHWYGMLQNYIEREGSARVPKRYIEGEIPLGVWVSTQRFHYNKGTLSQERIDKLEKFINKGWVWETLETDWEENYLLFQQYVKREGTARISSVYKEEDIHLGVWVSGQRKNYIKGTLSQEKIDKFENYQDKGWVWDILDAEWEEKYKLFQDYVEREGTAQVPRRYVEGDTHLGVWVQGQRQNYKKGVLSQEKIDKLEKLKDKGWVWDIKGEKWEENYKLLQGYVNREGNSRVPKRYISGKISLGNWVVSQRREYNKGTLSKERIDKLEKFKNKGWVWDTLETDWEEKYKLFQEYVEREGSARVPTMCKEGDINLGLWVSAQRVRYAKRKLSKERIDKLEKFKNQGWVWDKLDAMWEEKYKLFQDYVEREGTPSIPVNHKEGGISLFNWVSVQRQEYNKGRLSQERIDKLEKFKNKGWVWKGDA